MGTQLGLRDLVANQCENFNQYSNVPPRMLPLPTSLVNKEEKIRAYWMTEGKALPKLSTSKAYVHSSVGWFLHCGSGLESEYF